MSLLSKLLEHQFRDAHFEADSSEFIVLKNKHEKATGQTLPDDLLVTLMGTSRAIMIGPQKSQRPEHVRSGYRQKSM